MPSLPMVSLFTGAGGLDLGLLRAGGGALEARAWVESDPECRATLIENDESLRGHPAFFGDITSVSPRELMQAADLAPRETFLLAGGPPCQSFSTAGLRQSVRGAGHVVADYFKMVEALQPRFFVFENVRGLLSAALTHRPLADRSHPKEVPGDEDSRLGSVMNRLVLPTFRRLGYEVVFGLLNSADYGSAQVRHRVVILGSREKEFRSAVFRKQTSRPMTSMDLVPATHHRHSPYPPLAAWRSLKDAIGNLASVSPAAEDTYTYSQERASVFARIPAGKNWKYVRDNPQLFEEGYLERIMGGAMASGGGKEGYWRRLSWDDPAPTLTAQPQQLASSLCHPDVERPLSIPEYAALQDFPEHVVFVGSKSGRYRQIGNAVPVRLAQHVGSALLAIAGSPERDRSSSADC